MAPAGSVEDSRPQAILKLQPYNIFGYRVYYELMTYYVDTLIYNIQQ